MIKKLNSNKKKILSLILLSTSILFILPTNIVFGQTSPNLPPLQIQTGMSGLPATPTTDGAQVPYVQQDNNPCANPPSSITNLAQQGISTVTGPVLNAAKDAATAAGKGLLSSVGIDTGSLGGSVPGLGGGSVPVSDSAAQAKIDNATKHICETEKNTKAVKDKTVGVTFFGIPVPFTSWDALTKLAIKQLVRQLTNSTVNWINGGFNGNPAYVQDPGSFFKRIADNTAGDFIGGSDLNFLCTPFQGKIRVILQKEYIQSTPSGYIDQSQCTLSKIGVNLDNFYNDFNAGGWGAWFEMTQNSSNNPYGAYVDAKVELDKRVQDALGIKKTELDWNKGFLSVKGPCKVSGTSAIPSSALGLPSSSTSDCLVEGDTLTPGTVIENQLQQVLGQGVTDLGLARSFDDVISALVGALGERVFNSTKGLFSGGSSSGQTYAPTTVTSTTSTTNGGKGGGTTGGTVTPTGPNDFCSADRQSVSLTRSEAATWSVDNSSDDNFDYRWTGDEIDQASTYDPYLGYATGTSVTIQYKIEGTKTAMVVFSPKQTATSTDSSQSVLSCQGNVYAHTGLLAQ